MPMTTQRTASQAASRGSQERTLTSDVSIMSSTENIWYRHHSVQMRRTAASFLSRNAGDTSLRYLPAGSSRTRNSWWTQEDGCHTSSSVQAGDRTARHQASEATDMPPSLHQQVHTLQATDWNMLTATPLLQQATKSSNGKLLSRPTSVSTHASSTTGSASPQTGSSKRPKTLSWRA